MTSNATPKVSREIQRGIRAVEQEEYLLALTIFDEIYASGERTADGMSYYGLCLALVAKKYKEAIELCKQAVKQQFYDPQHYANLVRVYVAAGSRKLAVEVLEEAMRNHPDDEALASVRSLIGFRARPALKFLSRDNPLNVTLGKTRHERKTAKEAPPPSNENDERKGVTRKQPGRGQKR